MGRRGKKFIDRKNDIIHTFKLVPRSQQDPLIADEKAPQHVLVDLNEGSSKNEELHKFGIYFDDDYDYLQHLRNVRDPADSSQCDMEVYTVMNDTFSEISNNNSGGLQLPSSLFASHLEEPIGLLNRAAPITGPRPELDPDIVAELDDGDFIDPNDEDEFPDDFVATLNADVDEEEGYGKGEVSEFDTIEQWLGETRKCGLYPPILEEQQEVDFESSEVISELRKRHPSSGSDCLDQYSDCSENDGFVVSDQEEMDDLCDLPSCFKSAAKRAKSHGSSRTSASSSTVPRSELLSILDERFEKLFNEEYTDDQVGALDGDVIEGSLDVDSEVFKQAVESTWKQLQKSDFSHMGEGERDRIARWVKDNIACDSEDEEAEIVRVEVKSKPSFDCESILSTYSNTQNLPKVIDDRHLFSRNKSRLTAKAVRQHDKLKGHDNDVSRNEIDNATLISCISAISFRPKNETSEERRDRKSALKELRRERRKEKKLNKLSFKEEMKKQRKLHLSSPKTKIVSVV